jgi:hypothetical protein
VSAQQDKLWCKGVVDLGWVSFWEQVEAMLQQKGLVHDGAAAAAGGAAGGQCTVGVEQGPCLRVKVKVTHLE